jgi:hypothetical protein
VTFFFLLSRGAAMWSRARWPRSLRAAGYSSLARRPLVVCFMASPAGRAVYISLGVRAPCLPLYTVAYNRASA